MRSPRALLLAVVAAGAVVGGVMVLPSFRAPSAQPQPLATGFAHSLHVRADGTVWAWGDNARGGLGDGTTTDRSSPVRVTGLSGVQAVAAGMFHSLALGSDGTVWAWGVNDVGMLGDGTTMDSSLPVQAKFP